jgi:hypothetical protein
MSANRRTQPHASATIGIADPDFRESHGSDENRSASFDSAAGNSMRNLIGRLGARADLAIWLVMLVTLALVITWVVLSYETTKVLMAETGPIEELTPWLYLVLAAAVLVVRPLRVPVSSAVAMAVVACAAAAREWDLHKEWTGASVLKVSFYFSDIPWSHRLAAAVVVAPLIWGAVVLLRRHARSTWRAMRRAEPGAITLTILLGTLVLSKVVDRSQNVLLESYGVIFAEPVVALRMTLEEGLELTLPLLVALALWQFRRQPNRQHEARATDQEPTWQSVELSPLSRKS